MDLGKPLVEDEYFIDDLGVPISMDDLGVPPHLWKPPLKMMFRVKPS